MRHIDICYVSQDKLQNQHGDSYKNAHFAYQLFFHLNMDFLFGKNSLHKAVVTHAL